MAASPPRVLGLALLALLAAAAPARADNPMPAVRADQWAAAASDAASYADPVAEKLVTYFRLLAPGAASPEEIAAFKTANPDWPNQALLEERREEAIAADSNDADILPACRKGRITLPAALLRCADALAGADADAAAADARKAWSAGVTTPAAERAFLARWSHVLTPADELARFDHFAARDSAVATRQIARLAPADRAAARARLALLHDAPDGLELYRALPARERASPALVVDTARWLRHADKESDAAAFWQSEGIAAEAAAPPGRRSLFWSERDILARKLLTDGDAKAAYAVANDSSVTAPLQVADSAFLAGFIALTQLHEPKVAAAHFRRIAEVSKAVISQGRAHYWLGRAAAAAGKDPTPEYRAAAAFPTTFYGQLAARALGENPARLILALRAPGFSREQAWRFMGHELVRAAVMLVAWGEAGRARAFLLRMEQVAPDLAEQTLAARLAMALGMPDTAVAIARRVGVEGRVLLADGWPMPVHPPPGVADPAVTLALIRQESSFDSGAVSPAGARGLMQLMPATARSVGRSIGAHVSTVSLTSDPTQNMALGTAYIGQLLDRYDGSLPLAVAAYNAGPRNVDQWLADNGDPRTGAIGMVDWIERIPFGETRNYVQRVLESVVVYQARRGESGPTLLAQWTP